MRTYRGHKVVRPVAKRAPRLATVRPRISTVQRKTANPRTVRVARKAIAPKTRPAQRVTAPTKINKGPSKIIKSTVRKAVAAKRSLFVRTAQTRPIEVRADGTVQRQPSVELALTIPGEGVRLSVEASVSRVEVSVPLLNLPTVTLPPVELPQLTVPRTDPPVVTLPWPDLPTVTVPDDDLATVTPPGSRVAAAEPVSQGDPPRAVPLGGRGPAQRATRAPHGIMTVLTAHPIASMLSVQAWAMRSIGPSAVMLDEVGQRASAMKVPTSLGPATALVFAAAIGAAAIGTAGSGSAGGGGLAVVSAGFRLAALTGSRRLSGRLRESGFRRPRLPGFSPD